MDDKQKDTAAVGTAGAGVGFLVGGPVGAAIGGVLGGIAGSYEEKHQKIIRETHYTLYEQTTDNAKHHVDHIDPDGAEEGSPQNVLDGVSGRPDIIVTDPPTKNLVIEVETWKGICDDRAHALKQFEDFRVRGYKRVLVVPEDDIEETVEWVDECESNGKIQGPELLVASPNRLKGFME
jgi:hypothetical protein